MAAWSVVYRSRLKQVQEKKENIDLIKKWRLTEYYFMFMIIGPVFMINVTVENWKEIWNKNEAGRPN